MNKDRKADAIVVAAIVVAITRWVAALLPSENLTIPTTWWWWLHLSAILSACMAVVEGLAFSYVFEAWRNKPKSDKRADNLLWMALASAAAFVVVLAPSNAANVRGVRLTEMLASSFSLYLWSGSVALSTILIVVSVGFAQKENIRPAADPEVEKWRQSAKDAEARAKAAEQRATVAEARANEAEARFGAAGDMMRLLVSENKRERIIAARQRWPELPITWLALVAGASQSYVSEVINGGEQ